MTDLEKRIVAAIVAITTLVNMASFIVIAHALDSMVRMWR